jgi:hypothetical protein
MKKKPESPKKAASVATNKKQPQLKTTRSSPPDLTPMKPPLP